MCSCFVFKKCHYFAYTVGTEIIQTPLNFSLFVICYVSHLLKSFSKWLTQKWGGKVNPIENVLYYLLTFPPHYCTHSIPYWQKNTELLTFLHIIKKEKLNHMVLFRVRPFAVTFIYLTQVLSISSDHPWDGQGFSSSGIV